ncbi:hypothetical protein RF11_12706 [Thelohanellus kitauei]|uniref:Uncharacterized protein n=1 Tax=Thelohanellus kitauei TaxID=669202 RepID=A0A0C2JBZ2_THEKT|nr:hypothetical protein RF11_12706 [Thelohanellus kitauei]
MSHLKFWHLKDYLMFTDYIFIIFNENDVDIVFQTPTNSKDFVNLFCLHRNSERKTTEGPFAISSSSIIFCLDVLKNVPSNIDFIRQFFSVISMPCFETKQAAHLAHVEDTEFRWIYYSFHNEVPNGSIFVVKNRIHATSVYFRGNH